MLVNASPGPRRYRHYTDKADGAAETVGVSHRYRPFILKKALVVPGRRLLYRLSSAFKRPCALLGNIR